MTIYDKAILGIKAFAGGYIIVSLWRGITIIQI